MLVSIDAQKWHITHNIIFYNYLNISLKIMLIEYNNEFFTKNTGNKNYDD